MLSQQHKSIFCTTNPMDTDLKPQNNLQSAYLLAAAANAINPMDRNHTSNLFEANLPLFGDPNRDSYANTVSAIQLQNLLANNLHLHRPRNDLTSGMAPPVHPITSCATTYPNGIQTQSSAAYSTLNLFDLRDNLFRLANGLHSLNTNQAMDPKPSLPEGQSPSNFALTSFVTSALTTNANLANNQILNACAPLLQLAIRQAIAECLPEFHELEIQGNLKIVGGKNLTGSYHPICSTTIEFNDTKHTSAETALPAKVDHSPGDPSSNHSSSRRKPTNPSRLPIDDTLTGQLTVSPQHPTSPFLKMSGPNSPSTDSGVLDLSRAGSLAGSAPITPMKGLSLSNGPTDLAMPEQSLVDAYKKQLAAFDQIQNLWRFTVGKSEPQTNQISPIPNSVISPSCLSSANPHSEPTSPAKVHRRTRTVIGSVGRMNALRKSSSTRRFPCNQCREEFPSLHTLEEHTVCQHGTYRCHICKAQFTQRSNLQRHALKHVGFKPFECRVCAKAYYRKDHLMRHMEMGHPGFAPRENITVHLTSSESLDFLNRSGSAQPQTTTDLDPMDSSQDSPDEPINFDTDPYFDRTAQESPNPSPNGSLARPDEHHSDSSELDLAESKYPVCGMIDHPNCGDLASDSSSREV